MDVWVLTVVEASFSGLTVRWEQISATGPLPLIRAVPKSYLNHRVVEVNGCFFSFGGMHGSGEIHFSYVSILSSPLNRQLQEHNFSLTKSDVAIPNFSPSSSLLKTPRFIAAESLIRNLSYYGGTNSDKWIWLAYQSQDEGLLTLPTTFEDSFRLLYLNKLRDSNSIIDDTHYYYVNLAAVQSMLVVPVDLCLGNYRSSLQSDLLQLFYRTQSAKKELGDYDIEFLVESSGGENDDDDGEEGKGEGQNEHSSAPMVIRAHKELLKRRCAYWCAVFDSSMTEARERQVRVRVEQRATFFAFIRYLYTGKSMYVYTISLCK